MTIREALSNVRTVLKKINADTILFNKEIAIILNKHSEWLVNQTSESYKLGGRNVIFQTYNCAEVIDAPAVDECCNIVTNCTIRRTKDKIPTAYEDSYGVIIKDITSVDGSTVLKYATLSDYKSKKTNPWGKKKDKFWFYNNGYIYGDLPLKVRIVGLFKDDISKQNQCESCGTPEEDCVAYLDTEWTVPALIQARVIDFTIKELAPSLQIPNQEFIDKNENQY